MIFFSAIYYRAYSKPHKTKFRIMPSKETQINMFDFTMSKENFTHHDQLCEILHKHCKKWVFQLEAGGETGFLHYQCRVSLMKKLRLSAAIKQFRPILANGTEGLVSIKPTMTCTAKQAQEDESMSNSNNRGFNYVMKEETRVDGPWSNETFQPQAPMTRQLQEFMKHPLRPFQSKTEILAKVVEDRFITYIIEEGGNTGKSLMVEYLCYHKLATRIPAMKCAEDIMQMIMCKPAYSTYLIDMPRAMKKDNLWELYTGLEELKNGYCYDKRYAFKDRQMSRPQVIVFSNQFPELSAMSMDRWQIYRIVPNEDPNLTDLEKINPEDYMIEDCVNRELTSVKLEVDKATRKMYQDATRKISPTWMVGKTRSEIVAAVKRQAENQQHPDPDEPAYKRRKTSEEVQIDVIDEEAGIRL